VAWTIKWEKRALLKLQALDKPIQKNLLKYLRERIETANNPKQFGKGLSYEKYGLWRYRVQNYRIICRINEEEYTLLVVSVGHRKDIYKYFSV
jgi:mRNA interferase RelE/StbE